MEEGLDVPFVLTLLRPVLPMTDGGNQRLVKPNSKVHVEERKRGRLRGLRMSESKVRGGSEHQGKVRSRHD